MSTISNGRECPNYLYLNELESMLYDSCPDATQLPRVVSLTPYQVPSQTIAAPVPDPAREPAVGESNAEAVLTGEKA